MKHSQVPWFCAGIAALAMSACQRLARPPRPFLRRLRLRRSTDTRWPMSREVPVRQLYSSMAFLSTTAIGRRRSSPGQRATASLLSVSGTSTLNAGMGTARTSRSGSTRRIWSPSSSGSRVPCISSDGPMAATSATKRRERGLTSSRSSCWSKRPWIRLWAHRTRHPTRCKSKGRTRPLASSRPEIGTPASTTPSTRSTGPDSGSACPSETNR